jgi:hypothetical protein
MFSTKGKKEKKKWNAHCRDDLVVMVVVERERERERGVPECVCVCPSGSPSTRGGHLKWKFIHPKRAVWRAQGGVP